MSIATLEPPAPTQDNAIKSLLSNAIKPAEEVEDDTLAEEDKPPKQWLSKSALKALLDQKVVYEMQPAPSWEVAEYSSDHHIQHVSTTFAVPESLLPTRYQPPGVFIEPDKSDADILRDAYRLLVRRGWIRGHLIDRATGKVCTVGAIALSQGWITEENHKIPDERVPQLMRLSARLLNEVGVVPASANIIYALTHWNDYSVRDVGEIMYAFEKAEKRARGERHRPAEPRRIRRGLVPHIFI